LSELNARDLITTVPVIFAGQPANANLFSLREPDTVVSHGCLAATGRNLTGVGVAAFVCRGFKKNASDDEILAMAKAN
jgi:hypothetical protein